jgi:hypothetical protein
VNRREGEPNGGGGEDSCVGRNFVTMLERASLSLPLQVFQEGLACACGVREELSRLKRARRYSGAQRQQRRGHGCRQHYPHGAGGARRGQAAASSSQPILCTTSGRSQSPLSATPRAEVCAALTGAVLLCTHGACRYIRAVPPSARLSPPAAERACTAQPAARRCVRSGRSRPYVESAPQRLQSAPSAPPRRP